MSVDPSSKETRKARRLAYSAAAGAAVAAAGTSADAAIVYSGIQDISIGQGGSQNLDLNFDEFQDIQLKNYVFFGGNYQGAFIHYAPGAMVTFTVGLNYVSALDAGSLVDYSTLGSYIGSMAYGNYNPNAQFVDADNKYIGFGFLAGEDFHFAWTRVSIDNAAGTFVIHDWAYESESGVSILTGDQGSAVLGGDFNGDQIVDAADYTVWRNALGSDFDLNGAGDETGDSQGVVDQADYQLWKANFGLSASGAGSLSSSPTPVPTPSTLGLLAAGSLGLVALRQWRRS